MWRGTRRDFLRAAAAGGVAGRLALDDGRLWAQIPGDRPAQDPSVHVLDPQMRVPVSLIVDDSTCLVNLAHFGMPQFAEVWPDRAEYKKPWQRMPREIPDAFVRKFGQWCREHGVKGKYSIVPYPACVGWLDRVLPGWSHQELAQSLDLVRTLMLPDWDIHPEMISHTRVIDTKTGRPFEPPNPRFMENWSWTDGKSVDELAEYMRYALQILKHVGLPCTGVTSPGGFGGRVPAEMAQATLQACRDVLQEETPHYFRDLFTDRRSVVPQVQYASHLDGPDPKCVVSIIGCTGDWFGGWDGMTPGSADLFITRNLKAGRLVDVIGRGEPAILVCHWPGMYFGGEEVGFKIFQEVFARLHARYDNLIWMKLSEIARYWAARQLTRIQRQNGAVTFHAPFAAPRFTVAVPSGEQPAPKVTLAGKPTPLDRVSRPLDLKPGTWTRDRDTLVVCFDLHKGISQLNL